MKKQIKIHPIIKKLQKIEQEAMKGKYFFAITPINEAINKIGWIVAGINASSNNKEGKCKGWS